MVDEEAFSLPNEPPFGPPWGQAEGGEPSQPPVLRVWLRLRGDRVHPCFVGSDPPWFTPEEAALLGALVDGRRARFPLVEASEIVQELGEGRPGREEWAAQALNAALQDWHSRWGGAAGRARAFAAALREAVDEQKGELSFKAYKLR